MDDRDLARPEPLGEVLRTPVEPDHTADLPVRRAGVAGPGVSCRVPSWHAARCRTRSRIALEGVALITRSHPAERSAAHPDCAARSRRVAAAQGCWRRLARASSHQLAGMGERGLGRLQPAIIRASSAARSRSETSDAARRHLAVVGLDHDVVPVGEGGDLGEVGDHDHLAVPGQQSRAAGRSRPRPAPPTPASTSSKTSVPGRRPAASTTSTASRTRDSSPPEATLPRLRGSLPGLAVNSRSDLVGAVRAELGRSQLERAAARAASPAPPARRRTCSANDPRPPPGGLISSREVRQLFGQDARQSRRRSSPIRSSLD